MSGTRIATLSMIHETNKSDSYSKRTNIQTENAVPVGYLKVATPMHLYTVSTASTQENDHAQKTRLASWLNCQTDRVAWAEERNCNRDTPIPWPSTSLTKT